MEQKIGSSMLSLDFRVPPLCNFGPFSFLPVLMYLSGGLFFLANAIKLYRSTWSISRPHFNCCACVDQIQINSDFYTIEFYYTVPIRILPLQVYS